MTWWLIPSLIGVIIAGVAVGLLISFIILKMRKQSLPFALHKASAVAINAGQSPVISKPAVLSPKPEKPVGRIKPIPAAESALPENVRHSSTSDVGKPADILIELEKNLVIASQPVADHLRNFYTDVWNSQRFKLVSIDPALFSDLNEAYVDMLLANNLVWLTAELKRDSQDMTASYLKLKDKIAERLQRIMPQIRRQLQSGKR